jgi:hypothetical protein
VNDKLLNRIISVAYGDATFLENVKIARLARRDQEVKSVLEEYRKVANKTHGLNLEDCPNEVIKSVKLLSNSNSKKDTSLLFDLYSFLFRRPAVSAAIFSVFVLALISTFIIKRPEIHQQYSQREIIQADVEVKHSLALIAEVFKKTSLTVEKDILTDRVSKPIKESLYIVNDYIQGEDNENIN